MVEFVGYFNKLSDKQKEATALLASASRHVNLVGGSRSGKTVAIVRAIIMRCLKAPSRHAILRFHAAAIWPSIGLQTFPFVMKNFFPRHPYHTRLSDRCFILPTEGGNSEVWLGGLDEKVRVEKILGNEYVSIFFNECSEIPYTSVLVALSRLAQVVPAVKQRAYYDLNPLGQSHWTNVLFGQKRDPISKRPLPDPDNYIRLFLNPKDHAKFLDPEYLKSLANLPLRQRMRFERGEYVDESSSSLWTLTVLEETRVTIAELPQLERVVVAVDPSGAASETDLGHDPIGIVVAGRGTDGHAYVLGDYTLLAGPNDWGREAVSAYHFHHADRIVAERNYGGAMVEFVIRTIDNSVPYQEVIASRGKSVRAEPVAALYEQKKVHHVGPREKFQNLEDELLDFSDAGYIGEHSPNRGDACLVAGTLVSTLRGSVPIENVVVGDYALTRCGYQKVSATRRTSPCTRVIQVETSCGFLTGTPDHLVFVAEKGWISLDALVWGDIVAACPSTPTKSNTTEQPTTSKVTITAPGGTIQIDRTKTPYSMWLFGVMHMLVQKYQKVVSFTTRIITRLITTRVIYSLLHTADITSYIANRCDEPRSKCGGLWKKPLNGIAATRGESGTQSTLKNSGLIHNCLNERAMNVGNCFLQPIPTLSVVPTTVDASLGTNDTFMQGTNRFPVLFVERCFGKTNINFLPKLVPANVVGLYEAGECAVYDISVENEHEFFANGLLVHNCVWAITELMLGENAGGWVEYYKSKHERVVRREEEKKFIAPGSRIQVVEPADVIVLAPAPFSSFYASAPNGQSTRYTADEEARILVQPQHVASLLKAGCRLLSDLEETKSEEH